MSAVATQAGVSRIDPLVEAGLRYGSLVRVDDPAMAERYNLCLRRFGLDPVAEVPFHVDIAGFSLEVATALGDLDYLDPLGSSRRFIIVTRRQADAPLIHSTFSCEKKMLQHFFSVNEGIIAKVTLRSALYGEIENHTYSLEEVRSVLRMRKVQFECHALGGFFEKQKELRGLVDQFHANPSTWNDDTHVDRMIELAGAVGDVRGDDSQIRQDTIAWPDFFSTTLFGGASFLDVASAQPVVIGNGELLAGTPDNCLVLDYSTPHGILAYFERSGRLDPLDARWLKDSGFIDHRVQMAAASVLVDKVDGLELDLVDNPRAIENAISRNFELLKTDETFRFLSEVRSVVAHGDLAGLRAIDAAARPNLRILIRRASPHSPAAPEVNRILARLCRFDPVTLFALDKPAFYDAFRSAAKDETTSRDRFMISAIKAAYMPEAAHPNKKIDLKNRYFGDGWKD